MSESDEIEQLIPYLRRFARACLGDKDKADECVAAALTELIERTESSMSRAEQSLHQELYQLVANSMSSQFGSEFDQKAWRAFILTEVERLSMDETAAILGVSPIEIGKMLRSVRPQRSS